MDTSEKKHVLILGSGWVGLYLAQYLDSKLYKITIISPRRTSAYTPLLASAACGLFPFSCAEESLRSKGRKVEFYKAVAKGVNWEKKVVRCVGAFEEGEGGGKGGGKEFEVGYDILVVCPGCQTNTFGTPGVAEHSLFMRNVSDAMLLRKMLFDRLEKANLPCTSEEEAKGLLHVAIVGGGPTGVEITAELSDLARHELRDLYPNVAHLLKITIYDVASHILGVYDQKLYEYATEKMLKGGVGISTDSIIEKVDDTHLHVKDHGPVAYGILLWVTGNKSLPFIDGLDVKKSEKGLVRVLTDARLRVKKNLKSQEEEVFSNVFALGDAADIEGQPLPTTAEVAVQKSRWLVQHLNKGGVRDETEAFVYKQKGLVSYIGGHDGIVEGESERGDWSGHRAWLSWRSGSFTWTRTWRNWVSIIWAMNLNFLFGKDVARM